MTEERKLSRRGFMKGAAIGSGVLAMAGMGMKDSHAAPIPKKWDMEADVVIAGYGGAPGLAPPSKRPGPGRRS